MDFENLFKTSFSQFLKSFVKLILFVLIGSLLSLTIILIPTVAGGLIRGILGLIRENRDPDFSELWDFDGYLDVLLLLVIGGLAITIGFFLLIVPGVILMVWWMYSLHFIVDRKMTFGEAMSASKRAVAGHGFWNGFGLLLIMAILNSVGSGLAGMGTLVTVPFGLLLLTNAYLELSARESAAVQLPATSA